MTPAVGRVLAKLGPVRKSGASWVGRCPTHEDRMPSLGVSVGTDGRALLRCHAGCPTAGIVEALGLDWTDLFDEPSPAPARRTREYPIRDADGTLQAIHVREDGPDGKRMYWRAPDGATGLQGRPSASLPLYAIDRLPADAATVVITEGEKATDALLARGIPAVGTVTGASSVPSPAVLADLADRHVVLWPDADDAGRKHMAAVAERLEQLAASIRVASWPGAPAGGDAADYAGDPWDVIDAAGKVSADAPVPVGRKLPFRLARDLGTEHATVRWVIRPWVAAGTITELDGRPKAAGKSTFLCHGVAAKLDGRPFLGEPTTPGPVVYLSEQPAASLRPTLERAGLIERTDLSVLLYADVIGVPWPEVVAGAVAECARIGANLLVVDTLPQFAGLRGDAENDAGAALAALEPLQAAAAAGLAVWVARHDRKGGGEVGESARGSSAFTGAVDIVLALRRGEPNQRGTIRHLAALSRFDETPAETVIELVDGGYVALGSGRSVAILEARDKVLDVLGDEPQTVAQLVDRTGVGRSTLQEALEQLAAEGEVQRVGAGKRGDPYRFSAVSATGFLSAVPRTARQKRETPVPDLSAVALDIFGDLVAGGAG